MKNDMNRVMDNVSEARSAGAAAAPAKKLMPFGGYHSNKVPAPDAELTQTGPGTPLGEYMRRFWHPVCMSIELTDTPRYLKILGEELVPCWCAACALRASRCVA
jgi:hypothetical protein